ncbi:MAG: DUF58 domain-containing protein [Zoogloeaceae bacterium]|nr:DUF58 domain-containing protein [Zoogloeaceae bacterium]
MTGVIRHLAAGVDRWLFRLRPGEPLPVELVQRRIFVLPTAAGLAFAATLLTLLIASINYSLSLGYAFTFLLAGAGASSIVHAFRNLLGLRLRPTAAEPCFAGEPLRVTLAVENPAHRPRPALRATLGGGIATPFTIPPAETVYLMVARPTERRGRFPLGRLTVETTYPLGLIRAWSLATPDFQAWVYPAPEADPPPLPTLPSPGPGTPSGRFGHEDFSGFRAHRPTDSPRHVAWKIYAREGPLVIKEFAGGEGGELALRWSDLPAALDLEGRLARLTAWVCEADRLSRPFCLALPGLEIPTDLGPAHTRRCLEALAAFRA